MDDKDIACIRCYKCNKKINKRLEWFSNSPSSYICAGEMLAPWLFQWKDKI